MRHGNNGTVLTFGGSCLTMSYRRDWYADPTKPPQTTGHPTQYSGYTGNNANAQPPAAGPGFVEKPGNLLWINPSTPRGGA